LQAELLKLERYLTLAESRNVVAANLIDQNQMANNQHSIKHLRCRMVADRSKAGLPEAAAEIVAQCRN
jgi:hypothetical protein